MGSVASNSNKSRFKPQKESSKNTYRWDSNVSFQNILNCDFQRMGVSQIIHDNVEWHVWKHRLNLVCLKCIQQK